MAVVGGVAVGVTSVAVGGVATVVAVAVAGGFGRRRFFGGAEAVAATDALGVPVVGGAGVADVAGADIAGAADEAAGGAEDIADADADAFVAVALFGSSELPAMSAYVTPSVAIAAIPRIAFFLSVLSFFGAIVERSGPGPVAAWRWRRSSG